MSFALSQVDAGGYSPATDSSRHVPAFLEKLVGRQIAHLDQKRLAAMPPQDLRSAFAMNELAEADRMKKTFEWRMAMAIDEAVCSLCIKAAGKLAAPLQ